MIDLYSQVFFEHYKNPKNVGELKGATHTASLSNASCGDEIKVSLLIEKGKVKTINYVVNGCMVIMASASILSEELKNKKISEILKLNEDDMIKLLGIKLTPSRVKCASVGLIAIQLAIRHSGEAGRSRADSRIKKRILGLARMTI